MLVQFSSKEVNQIADRIVKGHPDFQKPLVLEMLAHGFGYRNFDTFSGVLKKQAEGGCSIKNEIVSQPHLLINQAQNAPVTLYLEMYCTEAEGDSPLWAEVSLTPEFLNTIIEAKEWVIEKKLSSVSLNDFPDNYERKTDDIVIRDDNWWLCVDEDGFWFRGIPKHAGSPVETYRADIETLLQCLDEKTESDSKNFKWFGGRLFHDSTSPDSLIRSFLNDLDWCLADFQEYCYRHFSIEFETASRASQRYCLESFEAILAIDLDDVAEWVGLHYQVNYDRESEIQQEAWTLRYAEAHELIKPR